MKRNVAACCVVHRGPLVLAVSRGSNLNDLGLPGGKQELGETPENCALRELAEETGLYAVDLDLVDITNDDKGFLVYTYEVETYKGKLKSSSEGTAMWVEPEDLLNLGCTFRNSNKKLFRKLRLI